MSDPFYVARQGDRKVSPDQVLVRQMTREEVLALTYGDHPSVILNNGRLGTVKINGAIKLWKRDPNRAEIPIKYGMYECARLSLAEAMDRLVVEVAKV